VKFYVRELSQQAVTEDLCSDPGSIGHNKYGSF
jgi:hypothetical protein